MKTNKWPGEDKLRAFQAWRRDFDARRSGNANGGLEGGGRYIKRTMGPSNSRTPAVVQPSTASLTPGQFDQVLRLLSISTDLEEMQRAAAKTKSRLNVQRKWGDDDGVANDTTAVRRRAIEVMRLTQARDEAAAALEQSVGLPVEEILKIAAAKHPELVPTRRAALPSGGGVDGMHSHRRPPSRLDVRRARAAGLDGNRKSTHGTLGCACEGLAGCGCSKSKPVRGRRPVKCGCAGLAGCGCTESKGLPASAFKKKRGRGLGLGSMIDFTEEERAKWKGRNVNRDANGVLRDMDNPADRKKFFESSMRDITDDPAARAVNAKEMREAQDRPSRFNKREIDKGAGEDWDQYIERKQRESAPRRKAEREEAEREEAEREAERLRVIGRPRNDTPIEERKYNEKVKKTRKRGPGGRFAGLLGGSPETDEAIRSAFVAAEDGDCKRVGSELFKAEKMGANVSLHRKQLLQDCRIERDGGLGGRSRGKKGRMDKPIKDMYAPHLQPKPTAAEKKAAKKLAAAEAIVERLETAVAAGDCKKSTALLAKVTKVVADANDGSKAASKLSTKAQGLFKKASGVCFLPKRSGK